MGLVKFVGLDTKVSIFLDLAWNIYAIYELSQGKYMEGGLMLLFGIPFLLMDFYMYKSDIKKKYI